ncbi:unnamed protein product [Rotaria socialis]|nr:unnamed protein product [Rotaria socialis]CAF3651916.1 unnamed protein product [Rotaria socialis]
MKCALRPLEIHAIWIQTVNEHPLFLHEGAGQILLNDFMTVVKYLLEEDRTKKDFDNTIPDEEQKQQQVNDFLKKTV